jgi:superfamily I DNA/RNA helicase
MPPHVIVEARAGTGKTTTIVEGLKFMRGLPTSITPSPQQANVWEAMALSKNARFVAFVAFNKSIANELKARVPPGVDAMTMHGLGFKAVRKAFPGLKEPNQYRVNDIISELLRMDVRVLRKEKPVILRATADIVGLCKMNLLSYKDNMLKDDWFEELDRLCDYFDIDTTNGERGAGRKDHREEIFELVNPALERCKDVMKDRCIDFDDMVWLPEVLDLPMFKYDVLLGDEVQDWNRAQQALAKRAGKRLILVGDPAQSIYGFAGADSESMPRMARELGGSWHGDQEAGNDQRCIVLPLTVTRRCGVAIVKEANKIVKDFDAHENNPPGKVSFGVYEDGDDEKPKEVDEDGKPKKRPRKKANELKTYHKDVQDGDFIISRVNAPLVKQCFKFISMGRKANIQGRDIGRGIMKTIEKLEATTVEMLIAKVTDWLAEQFKKEAAKRNPSESRMISLQDKADCILCFCEDANTMEDVEKRINEIFVDGEGVGIRLSSIHRAKGLEAKRVFFLVPRGAQCPHPMARSNQQKQQELNLKYVGITRAIEELIYVS